MFKKYRRNWLEKILGWIFDDNVEDELEFNYKAMRYDDRRDKSEK